MESTGALYLLRLIHVLFGAFWLGAIIFVARFLLPSIRAAGPAGAPVMEQIGQVRKLPTYMTTAAVLTVLSGIGLYWRDSGGFSGPWMQTGPGMTFGAGGALGIVAAVIGIAFTSPKGRRLAALAGEMRSTGGPPRPEVIAEIQSLQAHVGKSTTIVMVLLVLAVSAMAVARYVP